MPPIFFDAFTRIGPKPRVHGKLRYTLQHLLDEMAHCSISGALVTSTGQHQYDAMLENRRLIETLAPHDHLFPVWHVMPHWTDECPEPERLLRMLDENNVPAVSISPNPARWPVTSRTSEPLLGALAEAGIPTLVNFGDLTATELEAVAQRYPRLPLIVHAAPWGAQRTVLPLVLNYPNIHVTFDHLQINYGLEWLVEQGVEDQLLFGSNGPAMSMGAHRFYVDYADVPDEAKAKIAGGNLTRLLGGVAPPREVVNADEDPIMREARHGLPLTCHVVDMHAHILDEGLNGAGGSTTMLRGGPQGTVELAQRMGVDAIGLMSWNGTVGVHAELGNQCVKDALDAAPDTWWGLGTFDVMHETPETMRAQMEALYSHDPRFLGIKPYPQYGIPYSDKRYDCWWEFGNERKMYAGLHPVNWYQPGEFDSICSRFPDLTVVAYHVGGAYEFADVIIELSKKHKNLMAEITLTPSTGGIVDYLVEHMGADRVVYGSDLPMRDPRQQLGWVVYSRLDLESKKKVLGLNGQALIDRVRESQKPFLKTS